MQSREGCVRSAAPSPPPLYNRKTAEEDRASQSQRKSRCRPAQAPAGPSLLPTDPAECCLCSVTVPHPLPSPPRPISMTSGCHLGEMTLADTLPPVGLRSLDTGSWRLKGALFTAVFLQEIVTHVSVFFILIP